VLSVAASARLHSDGTVEDARIVLGAVASCPIDAIDAASGLRNRPLDDEQIAIAADLAAKPSRPMDNTDFGLVWRKRLTKTFVTYALRELRGDDMRAERYRIARHLL
jgi:4-hydroxybenzoyl-CoA reductase subunit beta